ncbi:MAG: hypothetical protein RL148_2258 [Planctomycetota bacterium]
MQTHPHLRSSLSSLLALCALALPLQAQGADPVGRTHPNASRLTDVAVHELPALDRPALAADDEARRLALMPPRYAVPHAVQLTPATHGTWDVLDAVWALWRLRIRCPGASHVNLGFGRFQVPQAASVRIHSLDYSSLVRPFDASDRAPNGELWTPIVRGEELVVEYYVPANLRNQQALAITQVGSGYRFFGAGRTATEPADPLDGSGACNIDVVCPQGDPWRTQISGVAALSSAGSIFCTGAMVNNTAQDGRNFFLTAYHCGVRSTNSASLVVYWNYQNTACGGVDNGPLTMFNTGSTVRAEYSPSDFTLLELNTTPNPAWGVSHLGWSRSTANATSAVAIHHPSGDPKKISFENDATTTTSYGGTASPGDGSHVRVVDWDAGTTEPGSSGSPLFDQNKRVIGQLHGGSAACGNNLSDYYGRISTSWTGGGTNATRLSNWLDPLNSGATTLDARGSTAASASAYGIGCYTRYASYFESFPGTGFDLGGTATVTNALVMTRSGSGYQVTRNTAAAWRAPTAANLALGDDALSAALTLPFTFSYPGGSTTQVRICSNGYVWLNGTSTVADFTPTVGELVGDAARIAPLWMDLNPAAGGTVHFDVDAANGVVYCTWLGVVAYGTTNAQNVQVALRSNGGVEMRWRACNPTAEALVGWSPGSGAALPSARDLTASVPFATATDSLGLGLRALNRPVLGTTFQMAVENIPAGSSFGVVFLGFTKPTPAVDLTGIGMPGCFRYCSQESQAGQLVSGTSFTYSLALPNNTAFRGLVLYSQAATLTPGLNALGALSSNGMELLVNSN